MKHNTTFENGLNQDVTVTKQPQGTYRDLHNGMLISSDGNHYAVETALGNTVNFTIPARYLITGTNFELDRPPLPIGFISFIDKLVVFSTNVTTSTPGNTDYGEIGVVTFDDSEQGTYIPLYYDISLSFSKYNKIRGFGYPENEKTQRVYWTDFYNEGRVLNIVDPLFNIIPSGSLVTGKKYMVTGGAINYGGLIYGEGLPFGNIFVAGSVNTYIVANANPLVRSYVDPQSLSIVPNRYLGNIDFIRWLPSGTITGGSKMYFYRLGFRQQGFYSSWSYGSAPINVSGVPVNTYKDQQGCGILTTNSGRGIRIQIDNIDTLFDTIEVVCASFDSKDNVITSIQAIALTTITGSVMTFDHTGSENLAIFSTTDITTFSASILRFKDLATTKNYLTIGNIQEREEIDFDTSGIGITDSVYLIPADEFGNNLNGTSVQQGINFENVDFGIPSGTIVPDGKYIVNGNGSDSITYNSIVYIPGQTFTGVTGQTTFVATTTATVLAAIVLNKYTDASSNPTKRVIPILNDFWDYKGMATTQYLRQYWSGETYRFAIMFYDKKGNPYFARWIGDHTIQTIASKGNLLHVNSSTSFSLTANGIRVSGIKIPPSLLNNVSGFSILRAPRDAQRFAQGIIIQTVKDGTNARPLAVNLMANDSYFASQGGVGSVYTYVSPDYLFGSSTLANVAPLNQTLENVCYLNPISTAGADGGVVNPGSFGSQGFIKYYNTDTNLKGNNTIGAFVPFVGSVQSVNGIAAGVQFNNSQLYTANFGGTFSNGRQAQGGNCSLLRTTLGIFAPNGVGQDDITSSAFQFNSLKPLSNIYIPKTTLYGGGSPDAIANTPFISTGHYQDLTNINLSTLPVDGSGNYVFNDIDVFGGDSFVTILDYGKALYDDTLTGAPNGTYSYSILFPCESVVNPSLREGFSVTRNGMQGNNGANGIYWNFNGTTQPEDFFVNDGYTTDGTPFEYPSLPVNFINAGDFSYRVRWGNPKISGEQIDSFRIFPVNDFRDLDGLRGQINNLFARDGKLYYWQDRVIGYLPILERTLTDAALGQAVQLGVGGVIDRFDEFNSYFGNQHQNSLIETEYGFSWFDMRRRAWLIMTVGGGIQEISVAKGLQTFFNRIFENQYYPNAILSQDTPLVGIGITGVYDPYYKTTFLTVKNYNISDDVYTNYDFTIGYNHVRNVIVGFFDFTPAIWCSFNRYLLSSKENSKSFTGLEIQPNTSYVIGNVVNKNATDYVCILAFTTHNPVQPFEEPDAISSAFWVKTFVENEIYTHWTGGICKFYGLVYPYIHDVIINPTTEEMFVVDNLQLSSSLNQNFDAISYSTSNDTATDANLNLGTPYYRVRDAAWENNIPLGAQGRLIDFYLKISFTLNNIVTNPTISKNITKVTAFINSVFRIKL